MAPQWSQGGGGALLREKMVEVCAKKFIVIVDESKLSKVSGWMVGQCATTTHD